MNSKYSTLSAAIRAGALLTPQCTSFPTKYGAGGVIKTCALGAALHAATGRLHWTLASFDDVFPAYTDAVVNCCPYNGCLVHTTPAFLRETIWRLNDGHHWTREAIADFVESWENEHLGYETLTESEVTDVEPTAPLLLQQEAALQG